MGQLNQAPWWQKVSREHNEFVSIRKRKWHIFDIVTITGHYCSISKKGKLYKKIYFTDGIRKMRRNVKRKRGPAPCS